MIILKSSKLVEMYSAGNIVIPLYIMKYYKKLNIELDDFIFLMYLYSQGNKVIFDPSKFAFDLNMDLGIIMEKVSVLNDKDLLSVDVRKTEKKVMEEVINLESFFNKLSLIVMENMSEEKDNSKSNIFEVIEKEFGRTLSPIEFEIIKAWLDNNMSEELIKEALKEATFNGVSNLRYIDKILYEWEKAGIKTKEDVLKNNKKRRIKSEEDSKKEIDLDIMDWDWFDEDE